MNRPAMNKGGGGGASVNGFTVVDIVTLPKTYRGGVETIDVKPLLPNGMYKVLTKDNFIFKLTGLASGEWNYGGSPAVRSYDSSTGTLTYHSYPVLSATAWDDSGRQAACGKVCHGVIQAIF